MCSRFDCFLATCNCFAEVVPPVMPELKPGEKPKDVTKLKVKFTATADALPGVREFRLATPHGASTI